MFTIEYSNDRMIGSGQRRPAMGGRRTEQVGHGMAVALKVEYSTQATLPPAPPLTASPQSSNRPPPNSNPAHRPDGLHYRYSNSYNQFHEALYMHAPS